MTRGPRPGGTARDTDRGPERTDEKEADTMSSGDDTRERNPFAPPPEDAPDQPWQPRFPYPQAPHGDRPDQGRPGAQDGGASQPGSPTGSPTGTSGQGGASGSGGEGSGGNGSGDEPVQVPPPHPWSPGYRGGWTLPPQPQQPVEPSQPRFDPSNPVHRRARHALTAGLAGLFCLLYGIHYVALLLGALAVYWGISALRSKDAGAGKGSGTGAAAGTGAGPAAPPAPVTVRPGQLGNPVQLRPHAPAALGGLITGAITVLMTLAAFGVSIGYQDYLQCYSDATTSEAQQGCSDLAPAWLVNLYSAGDN